MIMNIKKWIQKIILILVCWSSAQLTAQQFKALIITETIVWHHESIDYGIIAINELAKTHNFEVTRHQKGIPITSSILNAYEVVIFLSTTGDIFNDEEQAAFEKYIQSGNGYVGIHAASDTEYEWGWYTKLVGRMFKIHPEQQTAHLNFIDKNFPGLEHFPDKLLFTDEWYDFYEETVNDLNYLITVDESSYNPKADWSADGRPKSNGMGNFHPISWYHEFDGGRSFYTALGHIDKVYENHWFLEHLYGGIYYAATGKGISE